MPMEMLTLECLRCGDTREVPAPADAHVHAGECDRCEYVGWAHLEELDESLRKRLRDRLLPERRIRIAS